MHYHGFHYFGPGAEIVSFDGNNRSIDGNGFSTSKVPPFALAHWLRKPRQFVQGTWDTAQEAYSWLEELAGSAELRPLFDPEGAVKQLEAGTDIMTSGWTSGSHYAAVYVICCPNAVPSAPCPIGKTDTRPENSSRLTSIP